MEQAKHFAVVKEAGRGVFCSNPRCYMGEKLKSLFGKTERKYWVSRKGTAERKVSEDFVQRQASLPEYFYYYEIRASTNKTEEMTRRPGVTKETLAERKVCG